RGSRSSPRLDRGDDVRHDPRPRAGGALSLTMGGYAAPLLPWEVPQRLQRAPIRGTPAGSTAPPPIPPFDPLGHQVRSRAPLPSLLLRGERLSPLPGAVPVGPIPARGVYQQPVAVRRDVAPAGGAEARGAAPLGLPCRHPRGGAMGDMGSRY